MKMNRNWLFKLKPAYNCAGKNGAFPGVSIDVEYLKELSAYMTEKLAELEDIIYQLAGGLSILILQNRLQKYYLISWK